MYDVSDWNVLPVEMVEAEMIVAVKIQLFRHVNRQEGEGY